MPLIEKGEKLALVNGKVEGDFSQTSLRNEGGGLFYCFFLCSDCRECFPVYSLRVEEKGRGAKLHPSIMCGDSF